MAPRMNLWLRFGVLLSLVLPNLAQADPLDTYDIFASQSNGPFLPAAELGGLHINTSQSEVVVGSFAEVDEFLAARGLLNDCALGCPGARVAIEVADPAFCTGSCVLSIDLLGQLGQDDIRIDVFAENTRMVGPYVVFDVVGGDAFNLTTGQGLPFIWESTDNG